MREYIMRDDSKALPTRMETIVRCRDCTHVGVRYDKSGKRFLWCENERHDNSCFYPEVSANGFCAWGEPRETGLHG